MIIPLHLKGFVIEKPLLLNHNPDLISDNFF
jgi:hypothetical protein